MSLHCMLDLETLSTVPDAAVVAVGAVIFESAPELPADAKRFYSLVRLESAMRTGGIVDAATIAWWMNKSDEARKEVFFNQEKEQTMRKALYDFSEWYLRHTRRNTAAIPLWGNGADFDNVVLRRAYARQEIPAPWEHKSNRCFRTVKNLFSVPEPERTGVHHNALDDAMHQMAWLRGIFAAMQAGGAVAELAAHPLEPEPARVMGVQQHSEVSDKPPVVLTPEEQAAEADALAMINDFGTSSF